SSMIILVHILFFFQAEDGIRDFHVTGIQTCALPISPQPFEKAICTLTYHFPDRRRRDPDNFSGKFIMDPLVAEGFLVDDSFDHRSEERRVGNEGRAQRSLYS